MTNRKTTKRALLGSVIAMILCFSMLLGSTYAWFTDTVTNTKNTIVAGNLDVELYESKENAEDLADWNEVDGETDLFTDINGDVITYWEPGVVGFSNLKVANVGTLALKYQLAINIASANSIVREVEGENKTLTLADALKVAVVPGGVEGTRAEVLAACTEWKDMKTFTLSGSLLEGGESSETYAIVIYWEPGDNDWDNLFNVNNGAATDNQAPLTIELGVNLYATQEMHENDSFGPDYDEDAWMEGMEIYSAADLVSAVGNGQAAILTGDVAVDDTLVISNGTALNLNGKTLTADDVTVDGAVVIANGTLELADDASVFAEAGNSITLDNVVIDSESLSVIAEAGGNVTLKNVTFETTTNSNPLQNYGGTMTLDGVTVSQQGEAASSWYKSALQVVNTIKKDSETGKWQIVSQANTTINGGTFTGDKALQISAPGGNVTINGGIFTGATYAIQDDFAPNNYLDGANYESVITINGGTFNGDIKVSKATKLVITGGYFNGQIIAAEGAEVIVTGGYFTYRIPVEYCADTHRCNSIAKVVVDGVEYGYKVNAK